MKSKLDANEMAIRDLLGRLKRRWINMGWDISESFLCWPDNEIEAERHEALANHIRRLARAHPAAAKAAGIDEDF